MAAVALLTYSFTNVIGGNGYLAVYIFGIIIGNKSFLGKRDIIFFFDGFTELMSIGLFFYLGYWQVYQIIEHIPISFIIMLFMTFVARPVSVVGLMIPFKLKKIAISYILGRAQRSCCYNLCTFAIMVVNQSNGQNILNIDVYHIVFGICFCLLCYRVPSWHTYPKNPI